MGAVRWAVELLLGDDWRAVEVAIAALEDLSTDESLTALDLLVVQAALRTWATGVAEDGRV